ncbi:MAG: hypothetical protein GEV06_05680 [Luteitalea sp.]|nr:hypothetical protein [Luteitalea sp.]
MPWGPTGPTGPTGPGGPTAPGGPCGPGSPCSPLALNVRACSSSPHCSPASVSIARSVPCRSSVTIGPSSPVPDVRSVTAKQPSTRPSAAGIEATALVIVATTIATVVTAAMIIVTDLNQCLRMTTLLVHVQCRRRRATHAAAVAWRRAFGPARRAPRWAWATDTCDLQMRVRRIWLHVTTNVRRNRLSTPR